MNNAELAKSSLKVAKTGWYRYLSALWLLNLVLIIDLLTDQQFLSDKGKISIFTLSVPRIAFSFTYSSLFGVFAVWAACSAKTTQEIICSSPDNDLIKNISISPEYRLWGLSPLNSSIIMRIAFWLLSGNGLLIILGVTVAHLCKFFLPPEKTMNPGIYQGIGVYSALILVISVFLTLRWIYPAWNSIYQRFSEVDMRQKAHIDVV